MANIHHLSVGYVSPKYHLVFDKLFETVFSTGNDALLDYSDCDLYFYDDEFITNDPLVYHLPPLDEVWLSEPEHCACCSELEEFHHITEDGKQFKWIDKTPVEPSDPLPHLIEQSDVIVKLQTTHLQSLFQMEEMMMQDDVSIVPINAPEGSPPNIPYVEEDDAPVASDSASVADSHNPVEPDPECLC